MANLFHPTTQSSDEGDNHRKEVFRAAIKRYGAFILDYLGCKIQDAHMIRDVSQELWAHVWMHFAIEDIDNPGLLRKKAHQILVNHLRKAGARDFVEFTNEVPDVAGGSTFNQPFTAAEEASFARDFWQLFPNVSLTDQQKRAFMLRHRFGFTLEEIAAQMKVRTSTVHSWIESLIAKCRSSSTREEL